MTQNQCFVRVPGGRKRSLGRARGARMDNLGVLAIVQARLTLRFCRCEHRCKTSQNYPHTHIPQGRKRGLGRVGGAGVDKLGVHAVQALTQTDKKRPVRAQV